MNQISLIGDHQKLIARVRDLERVVFNLDRIVDKLTKIAEAQEKRGPGRPRKDEAA